MRHARIESGIVREIINFDPAGRFHPSIVWVACPVEFGECDLYDGTFSHPAPPPPQPVLPIIVSPRQIRQALTAAGLRAQVESAVAAGSQDLKDWWEFATAFEENHPMVSGMATGLGATESQLHDLFVLARSL